MKDLYNQEVLITNGQISRYDIEELKNITSKNRFLINHTDNGFRTFDKKDIKKTTFYKDDNQSFVFYMDYIEDQKYLIKDSIPDLKWEIRTDENKNILGYHCEQAKLKFRGANFTAYFTRELPYSFGPWKFHGLPGVILEIALDENDTYYWKAEKVIYPYKNSKIDLTFKKADYNTELKEFVNKKEQAVIQKAKKKAAEVSKDGKFSVIYKRPWPEKIYEWEKK